MVQPLKAPPPRRPRRDETVVETLLDAVLDGRYPPGSALPPERDLARHLEVDRTSLRRALARLEQMGVVSAHQGRGTTVLDVGATTDPALMARLVLRLGPSLLVELFEVRDALGALAGRLAAQRAGPRDHERLRDELEAVRRAADAAARQRAELALFAALVDAARNRPLRTMLRWAEVAYGDAAERFVAAFEPADAVVADLARIVDAVEAGRGDDAEAATRRYAVASAARMLGASTEGSGR